MKNIKNIVKLFFLLTLVVFTSCDQNDYEVPESFTDLSIALTSGASSAREAEVNRFFSLMDMSAGAVKHEWRIPKGSFFLKGPIPNNLTNHDEYIINAGDTISSDKTVHVLFKKGDTATVIQYYGEFNDSTSFIYNSFWDSSINANVEDTIKTIKIGDKWVAEHNFILDVYDTVVAAAELRLTDGTVIDHVDTPSMTFTFGDTLVFEDLSNFLPNNNARPDESRWRLHTIEDNEEDWTYRTIGTQTRDGDMEKLLIEEYPLMQLGSFRAELTATRARTETLRQSQDIYETPMIINVVPVAENLEIISTEAVVESDSDVILIPINYRLKAFTENLAGNFTVKVDGTVRPVATAANQNAQLEGKRIAKIALTLETPLVPSDASKTITVSYSGTKIVSLDDRPLQAFSDAPITVYVPQPIIQTGAIMETSDDKIQIGFDQAIDPTSLVNATDAKAGFVIGLNGGVGTIATIAVNSSDSKILDITLVEGVFRNDVITVAYTGPGEIASVGGGIISDFAAKTVVMNQDDFLGTIGDFEGVFADNYTNAGTNGTGTATLEAPTGGASKGTQALHLFSPDGSKAVVNSIAKISFVSGTSYTIKFKRYIATGTDVSKFSKFILGGKTFNDNYNNTIMLDQWVEYSIDFIPTSDGESTFKVQTIPAGDCNVYYDDITIALTETRI
ncbi:hypothetical protein [Flavicella sediminum]|uniref:hypothetical protein n=1 Tax=Flavicella sediminum TaxID=2585141 RepID=UPI00111EC7A7|nr:hypothetical protein [Flavicella sediminum]